MNLGGVDQQFVEVAGAVALAAVSDFLALDAECSRRHGRQAFRANVLFAMQAHAEAAVFDAAQRSANVPQQNGITVQISDRQLTLGSVLHFIESIGASFNNDAVAIAYQLDQL